VEIENQEIQAFILTVKSLSDYDFSDYSDKSLKRRLSKILLDQGLTSQNLLSRLREDRDFLEQVVKDITVNTTEMFRDPAVWHTLRYDILPRLINRPLLNIWHPGCSTGQEVFSMMILLNEIDLLQKSRIYATDLNEDVLQVAKNGVYKYRFNEEYLDNFDTVIRENPRDCNVYYDVPYSKYFHVDKTRDTIRMNKDLLEMPVYKKHDLVRDPNPFNKEYDLIMCRNVIIYFNYDLQNKVFKLFLDSMSQGACLVLGVHESILGPFASRFEKNFQVYFKR
jgi:chemotaxis protein methyltransferase CheR